MPEIDYSEIGLKCGLEIHQQLDTKKLFCNCPSVLRKEEPDFEITRKLHAVAGESGKIDRAAIYQASLDKEFIYQGYDTTCLVELDEEPPHKINKEALKIVLQISLLVHAKILPLTQIMRKTVINGSNTSGFQKTVLIARDGYVETEKGKVKIDSICLEEDAARKISEDKNKVVYRLDRLGVPLIEITTAPDIHSPEQAKEVALHIGDILRSCKVKRGLGTIRQDVNISIKNKNRVEIKGVQKPELIFKVINSEIKRQNKLLTENKEIKSEVRKVLPDGKTEFLRPMPGADRMYPETDSRLLRISRNLINDVKKNLPKLKNLIEKELRESGLNHEMIKLLFKKNKLEEFKELLEIVDNPKLIGKILLIFPKEFSSRKKIPVEKIEEILNKDVLVFILENLKKKKISENQIKNILEKIVKGETLEDAIEFKKEDLNIVEEKIMNIIGKKPELSVNAYMGLVMKEFRGKIDGKEAMEIIKKYSK